MIIWKFIKQTKIKNLIAHVLLTVIDQTAQTNANRVKIYKIKS